MTDNLNPIIPAPIAAIEIDRFIYEMQIMLSTRLAWLSNDYGRGFRMLEHAGGKQYIPQIYKGNNDYHSNFGDSFKKAQMFFWTNTEYHEQRSNILRHNVSLIFSVNLELIDNTLSPNELFTQNLIAQVRKAILQYGISQTIARDIVIKTIDREPRDVYREFTFNEMYNNFNRAPLQCFRVNLSVDMPPDCHINFNAQQALINNVSQNDLINILLPTIDFSNSNTIAALAQQQITDLKNSL